jgi:outer membrane biosynthesis protein TonB
MRVGFPTRIIFYNYNALFDVILLLFPTATNTMKILETEQQKKSFTITTILFAILFLLLFFLKLSNETKLTQLEGGGGGGDIAVNFGNSEFGSGDNFESKEIVSEVPEKEEPIITEEKEIIVSEHKDAPVIVAPKKAIAKKEIKKIVTPKIVKPTVKPVVKPIVKSKPKPSKSASDALANLLNGSNTGDGNDKTAGNKGKSNGSTGSNNHSSNGGNGTGIGGGEGSGKGLGHGKGYGNGIGNGTGNGNGNYQLGNRKALNTPSPKYICNEQGTIVVQISVDKSGKVFNAIPGARGTSNAAKCLLDQAKIAAMNTRSQADSNAPEKQVGQIIYNFKLTQ